MVLVVAGGREDEDEDEDDCASRPVQNDPDFLLIRGKVYCDTCQAGFETTACNFVAVTSMNHQMISDVKTPCIRIMEEIVVEWGGGDGGKIMVMLRWGGGVGVDDGGGGVFWDVGGCRREDDGDGGGWGGGVSVDDGGPFKFDVSSGGTLVVVVEVGGEWWDSGGGGRSEGKLGIREKNPGGRRWGQWWPAV
ncbi:hypothetical protein BVC80_1391g2 [Macleaya cordata]|uniref:Uncharacterized protein n=1 Tax=Macleaya cordata TaxID=56857 RepID=A0A200Q1M0_MACCD|nr:hypothetical protein BVC80_1391g2 [Macleaya cordata]